MTKPVLTVAFGLLSVFSAAAAGPMMTPWGEKVTSENCWRDYPRPQMMRANWTCLNGDWDYAVTSVTNTPGRPTTWNGRIRVPYPIESALSGIGRLLQPDEFLWYTRAIDCTPKKGERILLHFDGVDFRAMVFIGHQEVTDVPHEGAQEPFTLDITDYVKPGVNELTVCVWDPTGRRTTFNANSRGKQDLVPHGCFYTRCSGIWQSVWMEIVPETYIANYNVVSDIDNGMVRFTFDTVGPDRDEDVEIEVFDVNGRKIAEGEANAPEGVMVEMPRDFKLWSPEEPNLYTFKAKLEKDVVEGYFAMRKFSKGRDAKGFLRFMLNNKPYYVLATLDQGWWPDGLLTPPSEEAMVFDIQTLKACGFNSMRKHIKVEPRRYYALCDKMGLLVLQDLPSFNGVATSPCRVETVNGYGFQRQELKAMIDNLRKTPSIVMWIPYNEGWSQPGRFLTHSTLDWVKRYDPSRLVSGPSGWVDFEGGYCQHGQPGWTSHRPADECETADTVDMHLYRGPGMPPVNDRRISLLGEFGGLGHPVSNHFWKVENSWGYGGIEDTKTREGLEKTYVGLMNKLADLAMQGLGGSVYTQTTDVEIEINGLMTYDRKVLKFDPAVLREAHRKVIEKVILPAEALTCMPADAAETTGAADQPIVVYNEDDSNFIGRDGAAFSNYLNSICRGTVTHFLFCPNSMRSNIGTKSIEPIWKALEEPWAKPDGRCPAFKRLHDAGIDPYQFYIGAARAKGVSPGISMRMNDHHWVTEPDYCALSDFWRTHPEFRREQTQPQKGRWNWEDYNFDYAHKEVRDYFLAYVAELLERYDVDVFECDWLRCTMCLRAGRETADAHFIGEFMREVRKRTDAAAARRGHPVKVSVRVCPVVATNLAIGYDVMQWIRDGSVDWVVGCNDWDCANFDIDVAGWESAIAATGRDVLFIPGLDRNVRESYAPGSAKHNLSRAEYLAWCDGVFAKGAKGVYLFNLFGIERSRGVWDAALNGNILSPKCGVERRVYPIWYDDMIRPAPYPKSLAEAAYEVEFFVGTAPVKGDVIFRCAFTGRVTREDAKRFVLNGISPLGVVQGNTHTWAEKEGKVESEWDVVYPLGAVCSGYNRIRLPQLTGVSLVAGCLDLDPAGSPDSQRPDGVGKTIWCEGEYPYHLQGVATDN